MFDHFKPWKLVAEMNFSLEWEGGFFLKGKSWTENYTIAFYEKAPYIRKIKLIGETDYRVKEQVERMVYKWRDHMGELPTGAIRIIDETV